MGLSETRFCRESGYVCRCKCRREAMSGVSMCLFCAFLLVVMLHLSSFFPTAQLATKHGNE
jgi:hypothetical protein